MADAGKLLRDLAERFWEWRVATAPDTSDDITRVERPPGWTPDWSPAAVAARRDAWRGFDAELRALDLAGEPVEVRVDARLMGSALARVRWELDVLAAWRRNPCFYVDQALVSVYNLLLPPPPFTAERSASIVRVLGAIPSMLGQARENLEGHAAAPFARSAMALLDDAGERLRAAMSALAPLLESGKGSGGTGKGLLEATEAAVEALDGFNRWLGERVGSFASETAVGAEGLAFFLHRVALLPYGAERLRAMGRQEWDRAVAMEATLRHRHRDAGDPPLPTDAAALVEGEAADERAVRAFYVDRGLLSQPDTLRRYRFAEMPAYLAPLAWLGVPHEIGVESRPDADAFRYVEQPRQDLPYFELAAARDPRTQIAHEGVHAQQLALSWRHPDPVRRRYYDSAANEGIAFYHEELMLQSGLFDDAPHSAVFVANAMRLRALRVEVDLALALGDLTLDRAADVLAEAVPMDRATAWEEAVFFSGNPGQGLSYQIGKLQVLDLLATAVRGQGEAFDLGAFHDRLWLEGNVPLSLQRWELLGLADHIEEADRLADGIA
ncbi:DUF885 family protein [Nonomuraea sp. bgisy101]|uniref:DUF885 family protein n=1 Tax=Nonomuraea sp. bgisy101 TaxID=3413784 RepID=UPI003D7296D3